MRRNIGQNAVQGPSLERRVFWYGDVMFVTVNLGDEPDVTPGLPHNLIAELAQGRRELGATEVTRQLQPE